MPTKVRGDVRQKKKKIGQPKRSGNGLTIPEPNRTLKLYSPGDRDGGGAEEGHIGEVQRSLAKRNLILRQLKGINERVQQILENADSLNDESHLVQFQVYKDQMKRLISRYEEAAKEREKVLINVNIIFQKELSVILEERPNSGAGLSDVPKYLLRDVKEHPFSSNLSTSTKAVEELNIASNRLIACVKDMLVNKQALKSQSSALASDTLLQRRHERMMQEMSDKALENIKLSNTVSQQEEELMRLRATFTNLRSRAKGSSNLGQLQADLRKAWESVAGMHIHIEESLHESNDQVKLPLIATRGNEESWQPSVNNAKGVYQQLGRAAQLRDGEVYQQVGRPAQLRDGEVYQQLGRPAQLRDGEVYQQVGRAAQLKDGEVYQQLGRAAQLRDGEVYQQMEVLAQLKDREADATKELLAALSGNYDQFSKLSVSLGRKMLIAAPKHTKEREDIVESIKRCTVSERPPADLANAGSYMNTIQKAATGAATKIECLAQDVIADSNHHIRALAADRSLQPEVLKARKDKFRRCKEKVGKLSFSFSDCYKKMMENINNINTRLNTDTGSQQERHADRLQELDRMVATRATSLQTQVTGLDGEGGEERNTAAAQEHKWTTAAQHRQLPEGMREATTAALPWQYGGKMNEICATEKDERDRANKKVHGKTSTEKAILQTEDSGATQLPHIVPPRNEQCDTKLKKSMQQLQKMADLEEYSLPDSILPPPPATHTSAPKQLFSQWKPQPVKMSANFQTRNKESKDFKQTYIPNFSSFHGYHRSIVRAKQKKDTRNAGKGNGA